MVALIVFATRKTQYREIVCTEYTHCQLDPNYAPEYYARCANFKEKNSLVTETLKLATGTPLVSKLPAVCWSEGETLTFLNPDEFGIYATLCWSSLVGFLLVTMGVCYLLRKGIVRHRKRLIEARRNQPIELRITIATDEQLPAAPPPYSIHTPVFHHSRVVLPLPVSADTHKSMEW